MYKRENKQKIIEFIKNDLIILIDNKVINLLTTNPFKFNIIYANINHISAFFVFYNTNIFSKQTRIQIIQYQRKRNLLQKND
jgi:hypothetical protein